MNCKRKNCKVVDKAGNIRLSNPKDMRHFLLYHGDT